MNFIKINGANLNGTICETKNLCRNQPARMCTCMFLFYLFINAEADPAEADPAITVYA